MLSPADSPLVLDQSVLSRVLNTVTYSEHGVVQISSGTQIGGQNAVSVEEERKVSDSEADVQRTLSQSGLELLLV